MFSTFRSITRLVIGGILLGNDGLKNRIIEWEQSIEDAESFSPSDSARIQENSLESNTVRNVHITGFTEKNGVHLGYLLIGAAFLLQENLEKSVKKVESISRSIEEKSNPLLRPIYSNRLFNPFRTSFNQLVTRGEAEIDRLIARGQDEEAHSRALVKEAYHERLDSSLDYIANEPKIEELVASQSVGLIDEIVEEVRERTVSADYLLEGFFRMVFRRPLRSELPSPPQKLTKHMVTSRIVKGGRDNK